MNVYDLRKKKKILESEILKSLNNLIEDFKNDTDFSPNRISIQMICVSNIGSIADNFICSKCSIDIEI